MIRHLLKLVWNRKRMNALIILEIFFSFLVLFVVGTLALYLWDNVRQPLGFSYTDVWTAEIKMQQTNDDTFLP
jgi:putative ABC transport system permease protein